MKQLHGSTKQSLTKPTLTKTMKPTKPKREEDYNLILNRLISGNGLLKR